MADLSNFPSVQTSFRVWVEFEEDNLTFAVVGLQTSFSLVESKAVLDLAVGNASRQDDQRFRPAEAAMDLAPDQPATIWIEVADTVSAADGTVLLNAGRHRAFTGLLDDVGPGSMSFGSFAIRAVLVSRLAYLQTGALYDANISTQMLDTTSRDMFTSTAFAGLGDIATVTDFWSAFSGALSDLYEDQPAGQSGAVQNVAQLRSLFGQEQNVAALDVMTNVIQGQLLWGEAFEALAASMGSYLQVQLPVLLQQQTVLDLIRVVGRELFFALLETPTGVYVEPYTPFVHRDGCQLIAPDTYISAQWNSHKTTSVSGLAWVDQTHAGIYGDRQVKPDLGQTLAEIYGAYKRRGPTTPMGQILIVPAPQWIDPGPEARAAGQQSALDGQINIRQSFGDAYARELALYRHYLERSITLTCPLRMDVSVGNPVRVQFPDIAGTGLGEASVFGTIGSVGFQLDAENQVAQTTMEVLYVRSERQQRDDIDVVSTGLDGADSSSSAGVHPLWASPYTGRRLDE